MRASAFFLFVLFFFSLVEAATVSGGVRIMLKGEKPKSDLSGVIVYLEQAGNSRLAVASHREYEMGTRNKQLMPHSLVVSEGATVNFPNYDPIYHNLFSVSAPNQFDLGLYKGGQSMKKSFDAPGIVRVFCNVHPQMSATIVVVNTPYFTTADQQGSFSLVGVPAGSFLLKAYAEEGQSSQPIEVKDSPLKVSISIDARSYKKLPHKNKFGKDYSTDENERY